MQLKYSPSLSLENSSGTHFFKELYQGRPTYVYHLEGMIKRFQAFQKAFNGQVEVHYAVKANGHPEVLKALSGAGCGADIVSGGEMDQCLKNGFKPQDIVFSGVGKTKKEIEKALSLQIKEINVESPAELKRVAQMSQDLGLTASISLRMNPDVNPDTHPYIKTGFRDNKFGMDASFLPELISILKESPQLMLKGLSMHIGSQILEVDSYLEAIEKMWPLFEELQSKGFPLETFNIGGGLGIQYESRNPSKDFELIEEFGQKVCKAFENRAVRVLCEPGRMIVGPEGLLLTEVEYIKTTPYKNFAIVNTGMHHLIRPALYQAYHQIVPVELHEERALVEYDIVGPICESSDVLGSKRKLKELREGELLAILDSGAYGASMKSVYNSQTDPKEVVI